MCNHIIMQFEAHENQKLSSSAFQMFFYLHQVMRHIHTCTHIQSYMHTHMHMHTHTLANTCMHIHFVQGLEFVLSLESADVEVKEQHYEDFSHVRTYEVTVEELSLLRNSYKMFC